MGSAHLSLNKYIKYDKKKKKKYCTFHLKILDYLQL